MHKVIKMNNDEKACYDTIIEFNKHIFVNDGKVDVLAVCDDIGKLTNLFNFHKVELTA